VTSFLSDRMAVMEWIGLALLALSASLLFAWPVGLGIVGLYLLVSAVLAQVFDRDDMPDFGGEE
jgi:hypothetical protein